MIWREKKNLLILLGVLLAANTLFFFTYRVQYENRLRDLDTRLEQSEARLKQARQTRLAASRQQAAYRQIQTDVQEIYDKRWSTQQRRLTALIIEVKKLAAASKLVPPTYSFTQGVAKATTADGKPLDTRVRGVDATTVGISFTVQGNYQQVRQLINKLELSPQFVIINQISLSSREDQSLTLNLHLKTLFQEERTAGSEQRAGATS